MSFCSMMLALVVASFVGLPAHAAQQLVPTKTLLVKNPPSGARKVLWKVKEPGSAATVTGDPTADGATLRVQLMLGGDQCISMPASGWSAVGSLGFKYKDAALANGPVKVALVKKTASGTLLIKALLKTGGPTAIEVLPGNPTTTYATTLALGTGDHYCGGTSTATPNVNDPKTFKVTNDGAPAACIAPCSGATVSCSDPGVANGTPCDDGIACTDGEFCLDGVCGSGVSNCPQTVCRSNGEAFCDFATGTCGSLAHCLPHARPDCFIRFCDPLQDGYCNSIPDPNADPSAGCPGNECESDVDCNDGNACTIDECRGQSTEKFCVWTSACDDQIPCTIDSCNPTQGCIHVPENPLSFCDDQAACTDDDYTDYPASCGCTNTPRHDVCNDRIACTDDVCDPMAEGADASSGCASTPACDDADHCTIDACDHDTQQCTHEDVVPCFPG